MKYVYNDGGRTAAGYKGSTEDCVCRAIAIATGTPYEQVYKELTMLPKSMRQTVNVRGNHPRTGMKRFVYEQYLKKLGWVFVPTMKIGEGCKVHLRDGELPTEGNIICRLSRHLCAVVDGVIQDTNDPSRNGTRCVYGYYKPI